MWRIPIVVAHIGLSHSRSSAGNRNMTHSILTRAPRAISIHMELMISMSE